MIRAATFALMLMAATTALGSETCSPTPDLSRWYGQGWGLDVRNTRYQRDSSIYRDNVGTLEVAWTFALDGGQSPHSWFAITGDTVFIGSQGGHLYALSKSNGCERWRLKVDGSIRTGLTHGDIGGGVTALFFGTFEGYTYAVNARTGQLIWRTDAREHPFNTLTGTPTFHDGRLLVPVSSIELALAINPLYGCCKSRGSLIALDAASGSLLWRRPVIDEAPAVSGRHLLFVEQWGPSGAPVWSAPAVDPDSGQIYIGTGENYTAPASATSDAIFSIAPRTGERSWVTQFTVGDTFNMACTVHVKHPNCPDTSGPDLDFGAPPIVASGANGEPILLTGQKSGDVHGIDAVSGKTLWSVNVGRGGYLGGVHWGMAAHEGLRFLYAPISDIPEGPGAGDARPGMSAVSIDTGDVRWQYALDNACNDRPACRYGMSSAIMATDELIFGSALDGRVLILDARTGELVWQHDTWKNWPAVNGSEAKGGTIDVHGPYVADDMLFIQSGYGSFGQEGGNALIAYRLKSDLSSNEGSPAPDS